MSADRVIGVDLGGTKILAGVVDRDGNGARDGRAADGHDLTGGAPRRARGDRPRAAPRTGSRQSASGSRRGSTNARGVALGAVNIPLRDVAFRDEMERRLELPVGIENDASCAAYAEFRLGAGRGVENFVMLTLGTGVGGGVVAMGRLFRAWTELGHMVIVEDGEPCHGACSGRGHVEAYCSGRAADKIAQRVLGPEATAHDLVEQRHPALERDRPSPRGRDRARSSTSSVRERVVIGGGFGVAAFDLLAPGGSARGPDARRSHRRARSSRSSARRSAPTAGLIGAGLVAFEALRVVPLAVCATPIGNLDDITLRVLAELRAADLVLAEDTRHTRILLERHGIARDAALLPRAQRGRAGRDGARRGSRRASASLSSPTPGLPRVSDPGARLVRAALDAGVEVTVLPGPSAVETALVASGLGDGRFAFVGFLPRKAGELDALWRETAAWDGAVVAFESPQRLPAALRSLARGRPGARGRGLPRADEAVRGGRRRGTAAELAERFAEAPKGEITLVVAPRRRPRIVPPPKLRRWTRFASSSRPARLAASAADVVARLTGVPRNDLYRGTL